MKTELDKTVDAYSADVIYYFDEKIILNHYAKRILQKFPQNIKVLDLGLGHGITANIFSEYTILDGSAEIIKRYKTENPHSSAQIIETYFEDYHTDEKYDLIIMGFILEHVDNPVLIMSHYKQFLKPDGKIVVTIPNAEAMNRRLGQYMGVLDDLKELSEYDHSLGHKRYYTIDTIKEDIAKATLSYSNIEGIYLKPFTTKQMLTLNLDTSVLDALCELGIIYPELSLSIWLELYAEKTI